METLKKVSTAYTKFGSQTVGDFDEGMEFGPNIYVKKELHGLLIKLHGPRTDHEPNDIILQWSMGNFVILTANIVPTQLHDGSLGWKSTEVYLNVIDKICSYYGAEQNSKL